MKRTFVLLLAGVLLVGMILGLTGCAEAEVKLYDHLPLSVEKYAFCVKKGDSALLAEVNAALAELRADGTFDDICNHYFGDGEPMQIDSAERDASKAQMVVATSTGFAPFEMVSADGKYSGIDLEMAWHIAGKLGRELVILDMPFDAVVTSVESGKADIGMAGLTITPDRAEVVTFTDSYYDASQVLVARADDKRFDDCESVAEVEALLATLDVSVRVGCQKGTTGEIYITGDKYNADGSINENGYGFVGLAATKASYDYGALAITALVNGDVDYVILDDAPARAIVDSMAGVGFVEKAEIFFTLFIREGGWKRVLGVGLVNTLIVAVVGLGIGIVLGTLLATAAVMPKYKRLPRVLGRIAKVYVGFFRGTPIVVQLLLAYYVLLPLLGVHLPSLATCVLVFGFNSAAYVSEIMRSGIQSVDPGQMEAGRALGLSYPVTMLKIVVPQAVKNILPTLGNEFIALVKDTSVVSFVAAVDVYKTFTEIGNVRYEYLMPYLAMALLYILLVGLISIGVKLLERRLKKNERSAH